MLSLKARILQVKSIPKGEKVGYNGTVETLQPTRVATLGIGYGDGLPRSFSDGGYARLASLHAPFYGRISMDFSMIDVSMIPDTLAHEGAWVDLMAPDTPTIHSQAHKGQTIPHEWLTRLGARLERIFV